MQTIVPWKKSTMHIHVFACVWSVTAEFRREIVCWLYRVLSTHIPCHDFENPLLFHVGSTPTALWSNGTLPVLLPLNLTPNHSLTHWTSTADTPWEIGEFHMLEVQPQYTHGHVYNMYGTCIMDTCIQGKGISAKYTSVHLCTCMYMYNNYVVSVFLTMLKVASIPFGRLRTLCVCAHVYMLLTANHLCLLMYFRFIPTSLVLILFSYRHSMNTRLLFVLRLATLALVAKHLETLNKNSRATAKKNAIQPRSLQNETASIPTLLPLSSPPTLPNTKIPTASPLPPHPSSALPL